MGNSIDDFRYKEIEMDYAQSLEYDARTFFNTNRKDTAACPLCGTEVLSSILHEVFGFGIVECICEFMYATPRPTAEEQHNFYQNGKSNMLWHEVLKKTKDTRKNNYVNNIAPLISKYLKDRETLIDIGCGKGIWLDAIHETNPHLKLFGVEPFADEDIKGRYNIINSFLEDMTNQGEFDVCSLMSVIEHINDPIGVLRKCYQILKTGGLAFITAPNMRGFDSTALKAEDRNWEVPQHINFFDIKSAERCAKLAGFKIVESGTFGRLDVDIVSKTGKEMNNEFLDRLIYGRNEDVKDKFQQFLTQNGLSGQLYIVARKTSNDNNNSERTQL